MNDKKRTTISVDAEVMPRLRELALEHGYRWGHEGSVGGFVEAIARGEVVLEGDGESPELIVVIESLKRIERKINKIH